MMKLNLNILKNNIMQAFVLSALLLVTATSVQAACSARNNCSVTGSDDRECVRSRMNSTIKGGQATNGNVLITPLNGSTTCTSGCGSRNGPNGTFHKGLDLSVKQTREVLAAADGIVARVSTCSEGYGRLIMLEHPKPGTTPKKGNGCSYITDVDCYQSRYAHLSVIQVQAGSYVKKGQLIAKAGGSNCVNGSLKENGYDPHLHFELRDGGNQGPSAGPVLDPSCPNLSKITAPAGYETYDFSKFPENKSTPLTSNIANYSSKGCVHFFPEGDLTSLSCVGESSCNSTTVNYYCCNDKQIRGGRCKAADKGKCNCFGNGVLKKNTSGKPNDKGGCSYGRNQMSCGSECESGNCNRKGESASGAMASFLTYFSQQDPELFKKLSNNGQLSLKQVIAYACDDVKYPSQNAAFREAWKNLGNATDQLQINFISNMFGNSSKNVVGSSTWDSLAPESKMTITACTIAGGSGFTKKVMNKVKETCGANLSNCDTLKLCQEFNKWRHILGYVGTSNESAHEKRRDSDNKITEESIKFREEVNQVLKNNPDMKVEDAIQKVSQDRGQNICKAGEKSFSSFGGASGGSGGSSLISVPQGDKGDRECNVSSYRDSYADCIFCNLFGILFETASGVAKKAYTALADAMAKIVLLGFAIWVSITILKFVSAMEQKEPRIMIKTLLNQAFVVIVVVIFLKSDATTFFGMAMEPIFNTGMKLAQSITDGGSCKNDFGLNDNGGLPISMGVNILCTIKAVQDKLLDVMALGSTSLCVGFFVESWRGWPIFPHMGYVIVGLVLWISALLFMVIYPFLLIDAVLQLSVATALLPMAVAAYAFPITRKKYVGKIWETFLNCMFSFVFLSIIVFILSEALTGRLAESFERTNTINAGTSSDYKVILSGLAWWGTTFLELVFIMLIGWAVLGEAKSLAENFAGTIGVGNDDIGVNVGTLAMSGVKGVAKPTVLGAGRLVGKGASAVGNTAKEKINNARIGFQAWRMKNNSNATLDDDGNVVVNSKSWFLRRNVTKVLSTDASGRQSISRTKTKGSGASTTTKTDTFFSVKEQRDKNGNVTSRQTEMKAAGGKYMINKDGSVNQVALHAIRNGSTHDADTVNEALLNQMLAERMPGIEGATLNGSFSQRNVRNFKDDKGRDVFEVSQVNKDGTRSNFKMTLSGNRALTEYETITKKGEAVKYSSDGIVNKRSIYQYNKDGTNGDFGSVAQNTVKNNFSFTSYYNKMSGRPMDSLGNISSSVPKDEIMFGDEDMKAFQDQIARKGQSGPLGGFK